MAVSIAGLYSRPEFVYGKAIAVQNAVSGGWNVDVQKIMNDKLYYNNCLLYRHKVFSIFDNFVLTIIPG